MSLLSKRRSSSRPEPMLQHSSFAGDFDSDSSDKYDVAAMSFRIPDSEIRNKPSGLRRFARKIWHFVLFLVALSVCGVIAFVALTYSSGNKNYHKGERIVVTIPANSDGDVVSQILFDKGVVRSKSVFSLRLRLSGKAPLLKAGTYKLTSGSEFNSIIRELQKGPAAAPTFKAQFIEGFRITQMVQQVDKLHAQSMQKDGLALPKFTGAQYQQAVNAMRIPAQYGAPKKTKSMEGFLFPATYELKNTDSAQVLASKQLGATEQAIASLDLTYAKAHNLTAYEVVIIASMIEREGKTAEDRPKIAAVIYNRLRLRMTLGIDATIQYAVDPNRWKVELLQSDLDIDSPYNTRKFVGLPPTPIANPGLASLQAAAAPAKVDYLYYVANKDGKGGHYFTNSYDDFLSHT